MLGFSKLLLVFARFPVVFASVFYVVLSELFRNLPGCRRGQQKDVSCSVLCLQSCCLFCCYVSQTVLFYNGGYLSNGAFFFRRSLGIRSDSFGYLGFSLVFIGCSQFFLGLPCYLGSPRGELFQLSSLSRPYLGERLGEIFGQICLPVCLAQDMCYKAWSLITVSSKCCIPIQHAHHWQKRTITPFYNKRAVAAFERNMGGGGGLKRFFFQDCSLTEARLLGFSWKGPKRMYTGTIHKAWPANSAGAPAVAMAFSFSLGFVHKSNVFSTVFGEATICNGKAHGFGTFCCLVIISSSKLKSPHKGINESNLWTKSTNRINDSDQWIESMNRTNESNQWIESMNRNNETNQEIEGMNIRLEPSTRTLHQNLTLEPYSPYTRTLQCTKPLH